MESANGLEATRRKVIADTYSPSPVAGTICLPSQLDPKVRVTGEPPWRSLPHESHNVSDSVGQSVPPYHWLRCPL